MDDRIGIGTPTPGRIVNFYSPAGIFPAIVTRTNPDDTLSLTVCMDGDFSFRVNVKQVDAGLEAEVEAGDEEAGVLNGYWTWPRRV